MKTSVRVTSTGAMFTVAVFVGIEPGVIVTGITCTWLPGGSSTRSPEMSPMGSVVQPLEKVRLPPVMPRKCRSARLSAAGKVSAEIAAVRHRQPRHRQQLHLVALQNAPPTCFLPRTAAARPARRPRRVAGAKFADGARQMRQLLLSITCAALGIGCVTTGTREAKIAELEASRLQRERVAGARERAKAAEAASRIEDLESDLGSARAELLGIDVSTIHRRGKGQGEPP